MLTIVPAATGQHFRDAAELFRHYATIPGIEACLDSFDEEIASLPGPYAPPSGAILVAYDDGRAVGVVGLRRIDATTCEMKRLYVREEARGTKAGRRLAEALVDEALRLGYRAMRLETLPERMARALSLYRSLGFTETAPHGTTPPPGSLTLEKELA